MMQAPEITISSQLGPRGQYLRFWDMPADIVKYVGEMCVKPQEEKNPITKQQYIQSLKERCVVCGYDRYYGALELHHVNRDKDMPFTAMRSVNEVIAEIYAHPIIVVCRNCHQEIHQGVISEWDYEDEVLGVDLSDCQELKAPSPVSLVEIKRAVRESKRRPAAKRSKKGRARIHCPECGCRDIRVNEGYGFLYCHKCKHDDNGKAVDWVVPVETSTYRNRDPVKRRAYMRKYMARRRAEKR